MISPRQVQLVIPMSGLGKRFLDAGYKDPKPLIQVDGKPMVQHVVELFPGVEDVTFICNKEFLESGFSTSLQCVRPDAKILGVPKGLRGPVEVVVQVASEIDDDRPVIVSYCDYGTVWNFQAFLEDAENHDGAIACYRGFHPHMLGTDNYAFVKEENGVLVDIKEKEPFTEDRMSEYASNGTYFFSSGKMMKSYFQKLIEFGSTVRGEFYVSMVYKLMSQDGLRSRVYEIDKMLQWGTPQDLEVYKSWSSYASNLKKKNNASNPSKTTLILPMAGAGSRFFAEGFDKPKPLLKVDGLPMFIKAVECLPKSDKEVFVCLFDHVQKNGIVSEITANRSGADIVLTKNLTQGQACTCELAIDETNLDIEDPIMISACDNGVLYDEEEYQKLVDNSEVDVIVWSFRNNHASKISPNSYAWLEVSDKGDILSVSCKKFLGDDPLKTHAIVGTMFFRKAKYFMQGLQKNYKDNKRVNDEFYVDDVINRCIESGLSVKVFETKNYVCWGTPNDYKTYFYWKDYFMWN